VAWLTGASRLGQARVGEPGPQTRFEAGDVFVVLGEPDSLAAAEMRLLTG
jgi:K+/H+ antiporter YhaU regulatory subunit KhtT